MTRVLFVAFLALVLFVPAVSFAQSPDDAVGIWKTISDEDGKPKSHVKVFKGKDGKLYGKIVKLLANPGATCTACEGKLKDKPLEDMIILWGLEWDDDEWEDGKILDPKKGKTYDAKIWVDEDSPKVLNVRGYIGPLYRTQQWHRVK